MSSDVGPALLSRTLLNKNKMDPSMAKKSTIMPCAILITSWSTVHLEKRNIRIIVHLAQNILTRIIVVRTRFVYLAVITAVIAHQHWSEQGIIAQTQLLPNPSHQNDHRRCLLVFLHKRLFWLFGLHICQLQKQFNRNQAWRQTFRDGNRTWKNSWWQV